jgi:thiol-disulfide isomerase/thioredoxin
MIYIIMNYKHIFKLESKLFNIKIFLSRNDNVILKFSIDGCSPCLSLSKIFDDLIINKKDLLKQKKIVIGIVHIKDILVNDFGKEIIEYFNISGFPTSLFFKKTQQKENIQNIIQRKIGFFDLDELLTIINEKY